MKNITIIIGVIAVLVALGFLMRPEGSTGPRDASTTLTGAKWQWVSTVDAKGAVTEPADPTRFVAEFGDQSGGQARFTSSTDCNRVSGSYVVDGEVLSIGQLVSTKMYCEGSQETVYVSAIALATSHSIAGDTLTVNLNRDAGVMTFTAVAR